MILTIKGADFSAANIGTLNTVSIRKVIGRGVVHSIPNFVEKGSSVNWTITLNEDYEFGSYTITMGGEVVNAVVDGGVMTISIANVTGAISISVATTYVGVAEPEQPDMPDTPTPDEPTPDSGEWRLYDSFNRANTDSSGIGKMDSGHLWEAYGASDLSYVMIQDNKATAFGSVYPSAIAKIGSGDRAMEAVANYTNGGQILLYTRFDAKRSDKANSYYTAARLNADGLSLLYKADGKYNTIVQSIPLASLPQMPILLRVEVIGDTHNVYVDNELMISEEITEMRDAQYVGIQVTSQNYVDDFKARGGNPDDDNDGSDDEGGNDEGGNTESGTSQAVEMIYDSFDRENTTTGLGTSDSGYEWQYYIGGADDGSKEVKITDGKASWIRSYPSVLCELTDTNKTVEAVVNATDAGQVLLYTRYDKSTGRDYVAVRLKNDGLTLLCKVEGTNNEIQTIPMSQLPSYPFAVKVEVSGNTHNVYVNDDMLMSNDITNFADNKYVGFALNGAANYVDNFRAEITK